MIRMLLAAMTMFTAMVFYVGGLSEDIPVPVSLLGMLVLVVFALMAGVMIGTETPQEHHRECSPERCIQCRPPRRHARVTR